MTALNIRKNLAVMLHKTANALENLQIDDSGTNFTKAFRRKVANAIMPKEI
jgi:hypothetical protein